MSARCNFGRFIAGFLVAALLVLSCRERYGDGYPSAQAPPAAPAAAGAADLRPSDWYVEQRDLYYGIPVSVSFAPADPALAKKIWAYLGRVDDVFNDFRDDSEVGRINRAARREGLSISDDLATAIRLAKDVHARTGGAFDITTGPLRRLWRQAVEIGRLPDEGAITAARKACGLGKVRLEGRRLTVTAAQVKLDFGGIVKGIAVDRVIAMLKKAGASAALVQVGGETAAYGRSRKSLEEATARTHVIGIQHPLDLSPGAIYTAIADPGTGLSAATSGNYRSPLVIDKQVFYHIFDPRSGRPVGTHTLSVSVAFPQTGKNGLADGLSTAGVVLGPTKALPIIEGLGGEALFLVWEGGRIREFKTPGWAGLVRK